MAADGRFGRRGNRPLEVRMPEADKRLDAAIAASIGTTVPEVVRAMLAWWRGDPGAVLPSRPDVDRSDLHGLALENRAPEAGLASSGRGQERS